MGDEREMLTSLPAPHSVACAPFTADGACASFTVREVWLPATRHRGRAAAPRPFHSWRSQLACRSHLSAPGVELLPTDPSALNKLAQLLHARLVLRRNVDRAACPAAELGSGGPASGRAVNCGPVHIHTGPASGRAVNGGPAIRGREARPRGGGGSGGGAGGGAGGRARLARMAAAGSARGVNVKTAARRRNGAGSARGVPAHEWERWGPPACNEDTQRRGVGSRRRHAAWRSDEGSWRTRSDEGMWHGWIDEGMWRTRSDECRRRPLIRRARAARQPRTPEVGSRAG